MPASGKKAITPNRYPGHAGRNRTVHHPFLERDIGADGRAFLSNRYYHLYNIQPLLLPQTWNRRSSQELEEQPKHWAVDTLAIVGGLVVLVFASRLLVDNAVSIAKELGVSEAVIGLTIVAAGTSMPELATSIVAAYKRKTDIAIGNIVGSNLFNILTIAGSCSLIHPIEAKNVNYIDLLVMLGISVLLLPLVKSGQKISRTEGFVLILFYVIYMFWLLRDTL